MTLSFTLVHTNIYLARSIQNIFGDSLCQREEWICWRWTAAAAAAAARWFRWPGICRVFGRTWTFFSTFLLAFFVALKVLGGGNQLKPGDNGSKKMTGHRYSSPSFAARSLSSELRSLVTTVARGRNEKFGAEFKRTWPRCTAGTVRIKRLELEWLVIKAILAC